MAKLKASEFEGDGVKRSGVFGLANAWEKLRFTMRTEQDPNSPAADPDATPDKFEHGGVEADTDWRNIRG